jgi:aminoglycoside phosphotransferase
MCSGAAEALSESSDAAVHTWFQRVLREGSNPNLPLADGLLLEERFYLGPFPLELDLLVRCCGPEPGIGFPDPTASWQQHVDGLAAAIGSGLRIPLLAHAATLVVMDGNHRVAAALQAGLDRYPTILMFGSAAERATWVRRYEDGTLVQPLDGGHVSNPVRIGEAVRREPKESSPYVWRLLRFLEDSRYAASPRFLGIDGSGREALHFVAGDVHARGENTLEQTHSAAACLRELHDVTAGSELAEGCEVVVHGDPKPRNTVYAGEQVAAFIDFDNARPCARCDDVGHLAWQFAANSYLGAERFDFQRHALAAVADGYRLMRSERGNLLDWIEAAQQRSARHCRDADTATWLRHERDWFAGHRADLAV